VNAAGSEVGLSVPGLSNRSPYPPASNGVRGRTDFSLANGNLFEVLFGVGGIISQFGGELDLQSTIADGADICKIRFRRPNVDVEPKVKKVK
jgi:hypothetical protein